MLRSLLVVVLCGLTAGGVAEAKKNGGRGAVSAAYKDATISSSPGLPSATQKTQQRKIYDTGSKQFDGGCKDLRTDCRAWAQAGGCEEDPIWMHPHCPVSCDACDQQLQYVPRDRSLEPPLISTNDEVILDAIGASLGAVPQLLVSTHADAIQTRVDQALDYMANTVQTEDLYAPVRELCRTYDSQCAFWAVLGECESNAEFMNENCAPVCFTCEQLHVESRCPIDPNEKNAWYPGDLNAMFEKIVSDPYYASQYDIKVLSRPDYLDGDDPEKVDYITGPWVVVLDNFLSEPDAKRLIELGQSIGYERSTDVGRVEEDGSVERKVSTGRTSTNAWCNTDECEQDPVAISVYERIHNLTSIPEDNSEALQLLQYFPGQFYDIHHDFIPLDLTRKQGPRILTVFLYLNDVEAGGGTNFPELDLTVQPKRGRALVWPSVLNDEPNTMDPLTHHQALAVEAGVKYGANAWLHQRTYPEECF